MTATLTKPRTGWSSPQRKIWIALVVGVILFLFSSATVEDKLMAALTAVTALAVIYTIEEYYVIRWIKRISNSKPRAYLSVRVSGLDSGEPQVTMAVPSKIILFSDDGEGASRKDIITSFPGSPAALAATQVVADMRRTSPQRLKYHEGEISVRLAPRDLSDSEVGAWKKLNEAYDQLSQEIEEGYTKDGKSLRQAVLNKLDDYSTKTVEEN